MTKYIGQGIIDALKAGTIEGKVFKFATQVERPLYQAVSSVLKDHGGKWSKDAGGIQFEQDPSQRIADIIAKGATARKSLRIVIEVKGGVAEVTQCPTGVEVEIIDHD